ncbi:MAG TPA: hypothetical protein VFA36_05980 [Burkholderiales bacterium]|nr:hypothetical protein [Burkholderiales bacterium]
MRARLASLAIVLALVQGAAGCAKTSKVVAPEPPAVVASEFQYSLHFSNQDGGFAVTHAEYADADGIVRQINYQPPLWVQTVKLKPGQRMYLRADVTFASVLTGGAQITGEPLYRGDLLERVDGPSSATVVIDQIFE